MNKLILAGAVLILAVLGATWLYAGPQPAPRQAAAPAKAPVTDSLVLQGQPIQASAPAPSPSPMLAQLPVQPAPRATPPLPAAATPTVGTPSATPSTIVVNTPTTVTVTVQITDPTLLPGGVNLLRLGATGTQPTILGVMHDDGKNGDAVAGDQVYTLQVPFSEPTAGQIQLQASAAFKGLLKRISSAPLTLPVWNVVADTTLGFSDSYPPSYTQSKTTSGKLTDDTGAVAVIAFGTTILSDGTSDTGPILYVYPLGHVPSQLEEPGPTFDSSNCRAISVSGGTYQGQLCSEAFQIDAIDGVGYSEQLTVITHTYEYDFELTTTSPNDASVQVFNQMISALRLQ